MGDIVSDTHTGSSSQIQSTLQNIFNSLEGNFVRSMSTNRVLMASAATSQRSVDSLIDTLATTQPGRFFVLIRDSERSEIGVTMSARCHQLSRGQAICSEVIMLRYSGAQELSIPSIVKANLLTGRRLELILLEDPPIDSLFKEFATFAEVLIYDSSFYWDQQSFLSQIPDEFIRAIDVQWLLLAPWREAIRTVFDSHISALELKNLSQITVEYNSESPVQSFLFTAWVTQALQLAGVRHVNGGLVFSGVQGNELQFFLRPVAAETGENAGIHSVQFKFSGSEPEEVSWKREGKVIVASRCDSQCSILLSQKIDTSNTVEAINRYFLIGESTVRYAAALKSSLEISQMTR